MSMGEQIRDYLPVEDVASKLIRVALHNEFNGTINCCSGKGITIKELVEKHLAEKAYRMELNLGYYPYNDYEPFKFWGDNSKWNALFT
jgi:dTDP-6-deoxy-L-talose 4-dehydrogenase (NAD+)